jgi:Na+/H+ antiporter NhaD/arsenite permease-like protein
VTVTAWSVVVGIAARNRTPITFRHFTKCGLMVTFVTISAATPYLWLRHLI